MSYNSSGNRTDSFSSDDTKYEIYFKDKKFKTFITYKV